MIKSQLTVLTVSALLGLASACHATLISHYTFDSAFDTNKTADSVGSGNFATLGSAASINTSVSGSIGGGVLDLSQSGATSAITDGGVTSNSFSWANDARTITYWWRAKDPNVDVDLGAYVSYGVDATGERMDIRESNIGSSIGQLRVEVQGTGETTNPAGFDDGSWQFVAVTVPNDAVFADIAWYVNGSSSDLNTSTDTTVIATGTSPLYFGDSIVTANNVNRTPNGYIDDFQLYDEVLSTEQISFLYNNPGAVIPEPSTTAILFGLAALTLCARRRLRK